MCILWNLKAAKLEGRVGGGNAGSHSPVKVSTPSSYDQNKKITCKICDKEVHTIKLKGIPLFNHLDSGITIPFCGVCDICLLAECA